MTFADKLKSERKRLGLTQGQLAELLDVSLRAVGKWEQGQEPIALTQEGALNRLAALPVKP